MSCSTDYVYGIPPDHNNLMPNYVPQERTAAIDIAKEISKAYKQGFQDGQKAEREYQLAIKSTDIKLVGNWYDDFLETGGR